MSTTQNDATSIMLHTSPEELLCTKIASAVISALSSGSENGNFSEKPLPRIVNQKALEKLFDVSGKTVTRWRNEGRIPYLMVNGNYRYDLDKVIAAIEIPQKSIYK